MELGFEIIVLGLFLMAVLYSSVGHGGASGYLAILSLSIYANEGDLWLKQHAWILNIIVAGVAFFNYKKEGFHDFNLSWPFLITSIPFTLYASSLKITLIQLSQNPTPYQLLKQENFNNFLLISTSWKG